MSKNSEFPFPVIRTEETKTFTKKVEKVSTTFSLSDILELLQNRFPAIPHGSIITPVHNNKDPEIVNGIEVYWYEDKKEKTNEP